MCSSRAWENSRYLLPPILSPIYWINLSQEKLAYEFSCPILKIFMMVGDGKSSGWRRRYSHSQRYSWYHLPVPNIKNPQDIPRIERDSKKENKNLFIIDAIDLYVVYYIPTHSSDRDISVWTDALNGSTFDGDILGLLVSSPVYDTTNARSAHSPSLWVLSPVIFLSAI